MRKLPSSHADDIEARQVGEIAAGETIWNDVVAQPGPPPIMTCAPTLTNWWTPASPPMKE